MVWNCRSSSPLFHNDRRHSTYTGKERQLSCDSSPIHWYWAAVIINNLCDARVARLLQQCVLPYQVSVSKYTSDYVWKSNVIHIPCKRLIIWYSIQQTTQSAINNNFSLSLLQVSTCTKSLTGKYINRYTYTARSVKYVLCFFLGNSPVSEFYTPTFRNTLSVPPS